MLGAHASCCGFGGSGIGKITAPVFPISTRALAELILLYRGLLRSAHLICELLWSYDHACTCLLPLRSIALLNLGCPLLRVECV